MGIDWEDLLGAEGDEIQDAYDSLVEDAMEPYPTWEPDPPAPPVRQATVPIAQLPAPSVLLSSRLPSLSWDQYRAIRDREAALQAQLRALEDTLTGRSTPLRRFLRDSKGRFRENLAQELVARLLQALREHRQWEIEEEREAEGWDDDFWDVYGEDMKEDNSLDDREAQLYESFLYCALRLLDDPPPWWPGGGHGTFGDLLALSQDPMTMGHYQKDTELMAEELCGDGPQGFFSTMDQVYQLLSGEAITATFSLEDLQRVRVGREERVDAWERCQAREEPDPDPLDEAIPEDWEELDPAQDDWARRFPCRENLLHQYRLYRERCFALNLDGERFREDLRGALGLFLWDQALALC